MKKTLDLTWWACPFLVATFIVTSLYAANAERLDIGQFVRPWILAILIADLLLMIFWLSDKTYESAPFLAAGCTICFLLWHEAPVWVNLVMLSGVIVFAVWKKTKPAVPQAVLLTSFVTCLGLVMTIGQALVINVIKTISQPEVKAVTTKSGQPNIYFIVPDRMPSPAAILESGRDPAEAVHDLQDLGFFVPPANASLDPYQPKDPDKVYTTRTMRFFASVLNGGAEVPLTISYRECRDMIRNGMILDQLHEKGYRIVNVATWFNETANLPKADCTLTYDDVSFLEQFFRDELSVAFFNRTILAGLNFRLLESAGMISRVEMDRHTWQESTLTGFASMWGGNGTTSQFMMAHIMLPHEPFIYTIARDPMDQYRDQIQYALSYYSSLARRIREADPTAYVIIQSDEGMAFRKPAELNYELSPTQWNGVFTAWYIPEGKEDLSGIPITGILDIVVNSK